MTSFTGTAESSFLSVFLVSAQFSILVGAFGYISRKPLNHEGLRVFFCIEKLGDFVLTRVLTAH